MNKQRRADIAAKVKVVDDAKNKLQAAVGAFTAALEEFSLDDLHGEVEALRDEEQEYLDNMPEGLQQGERGEAAQEAISNLENACDKIDEAKGAVEAVGTSLEEVDGWLQEAIDAMDEAQA